MPGYLGTENNFGRRPEGRTVSRIVRWRYRAVRLMAQAGRHGTELCGQTLPWACRKLGGELPGRQPRCLSAPGCVYAREGLAVRQTQLFTHETLIWIT